MKFQKEDELKEYAKGLLYQIIPNDSWSNVCYTYRISNKLAGSVYKIALNDKLPEELKDHLFCIELAHIRRQHYAAKQTLDFRFSAPKIKAVYNKLKPLFDDPVSDIDNMYDIFEDYVFKMLRDWEVFTNDFTEEEVRYLDTLYPDECIIDGQPVIHLLPQDVGYPPGLTANEYLILILQNPEQWFTNQMSAMQQAMDDLKQRKQNNGTQGGCNTNQSGATSSGGGSDDINHNKEDRERPKKNPPQNQQPQNQQGNQNSQNQNDQNDQGMGSSQQNQDAAANTQQQEWKDGKDSDGESNGSSGKQSNNDKPKQTDSSSKGSGKGGADDKSEQDGQSCGGSSDSQEEIEDDGNKDESRSGGSSSGSDKGDFDDADGENQASGSGASDEDNGDDGSESESSNSGKTSSDNTEDSEDASGETSGEEGTESDSEAGDGEPSGDGSEGSDGDTSVSDGNDGERKELTKEELDELIKQFIQKAVSDYQKMLEIKDEQEADSNSLKGYSRDGGGGAGNGTVLVDKCTNWIDFEGL